MFCAENRYFSMILGSMKNFYYLPWFEKSLFSVFSTVQNDFWIDQTI